MVFRVARRTLDALLILLVAVVIGTLVLARVVPAITGGQTFVVGGASMDPLIPRGSAVVVVPVPAEDLRVGDVVSVRVGPAQAVFTHRITRLVARADGLWIATQGDANATPDPSLVRAASVIGRAELTIPGAGYLVALLGSAPGIALSVALAATLLAGAWLLETFEAHPVPSRRRSPSASGAASGSGAAA